MAVTDPPIRPVRVALVALAAASLAVAGWAGLGRTGLVAPLAFGAAVERHGALMVTAIALLIAVERATVVRRSWAWIAPTLAAIAALLIIAGAPVGWEAAASFGAAAVLVVVMARGAVATPGIAASLMTLGAIAWLTSAALRGLGTGIPQLLPWWIVFIVLTIAGERHELASALRPSRRGSTLFLAAVAVLCAGTAVTLADLAAGTRLAGLGMLVVALWLGMRDRPPAASRAHPLSRFIALTTRLAYAWLALGGVFALTFDGVPAGLRYDALVHAVFGGFVLSMIMAHAPIVIPAIVGGAFTYRPAIYAGLLVLNTSTVLRVVGDLVERVELRNAGGAGIGIGLVLFAGAMLASRRPRRQPDVSFRVADRAMR